MAVAVDAITSGTSGGSPTVAHTCTGSDLALYVLIAQRYGTNGVTAATYNAIPMTLLYDLDAGNLTHVFVYRLLSPATGANNVIITQADSRDLAYTFISLTGVNGTTPEGTIVGTSGHDTTPTDTVASAANDLVLDVVAWYKPASETMSVGASQTSRSNQAAGTTGGGAVSTEPGAASVVMSWTASASVYWNHVAVPVKSGSAPSPGTPLDPSIDQGDGT